MVEDDTSMVQIGETVIINVLANDSDIDGILNKTKLLIVSAPNSGVVDIDFVTGEITYTHDGSATTNDSFIYTVEDDDGAISNEATVIISINGPLNSCGKAIELDGSNDWVNIPDLSMADDFTIESWVKLAPGIDNNDALFGQEGQGLDVNFYQAKARLYAGGESCNC